ncbi:arsenic resistance protein [Epibacterium sp. SM1969]|uniref:Arsenic resistance protein n=1 Tax=Tritonibacter aquimaris TaxID=2663379 RepID=A0A844AL98_9RHOB|nr:arsenic resistance protein [Tritonibacter aquimaris]MQY42750.1 arsenic resistance protein [Tritonibacter aquimaris]
MAFVDAARPDPNGIGPIEGIGGTALLIGAIVLGSFVGLKSPDLGETLSSGIDPTLLLLLALLFFEVRLKDFAKGFANLKFISITWVANFVIVPVIGFVIASLFMSGQPLLYTGLLIYFLAPCTDWYLGFTRMARGDTALGAALLPINMVSQLLLYPLWLWVFMRHSDVVDFASIPDVLINWFLVPFVVAQIIRTVLGFALPDALFEKLSTGVGWAISLVTAVLILQIFAGNIGIIADHISTFAVILVAIFVFFVTTFFMGEGLTRLFKLGHPQRALLSMTTAARNAPLMLAVTAVAIPDQPLVYAALVIGMLVEFPHLTALKQTLLLQYAREQQSEPA